MEKRVPSSRSLQCSWIAIALVTWTGCGTDDAPISGGADIENVDGGNVTPPAPTEDAGADSGLDSGTPPKPCAEGTWDADGNPSTACVAWKDCSPGTHMASAGSTTTDRTCATCPSGTFSATANATECVAWDECAVGTHIVTAGSATANQTCTPCETDTYSSSPNQSTCIAVGACAAGTIQTAPATTTAPPTCENCEPGTYCAGGAAPKTACADETWDHDGNPATACRAWTTCDPGKSVESAGSATADRQCSPCASGTYSTTANAESCTPWTTCTLGFAEGTQGSNTSDRTCVLVPWIRQFGSTSTDQARSVSTDASGNIYVAGYTLGTLPGQTTGSGYDSFVRKYDAAGTELWTRQFSSSSSDFAYAVSADASGNVYVAGYATGTFPGQTSANTSSYDAFVRKYDGSGNVLWTRQFGSDSSDTVTGVSADASGNVYVVGTAGGALPGQPTAGTVINGQTSPGASGAYVRKYDGSGNELWTRQFISTATGEATAVSADASGNVFVAGQTTATLPGQTASGLNDAFVRKYSASGNELWTRQFGTTTWEYVSGVSADASGNVYVAGHTAGTLPNQTSAGNYDAFVRKYDTAGTELWTRQFGSSDGDYAYALSADTSGNVFVAGATLGALPDQTAAGNYDAFVRKYDGSGTALWTKQLGSAAIDFAYAVSAGPNGNAFVAGYTQGTFPDQTYAGGTTDAFVANIVP